MEIYASVESWSGRAEVPNQAVQFLWYKTNRNHGVEKIKPFDFSWRGGDAWGVEDRFEDLGRTNVDTEKLDVLLRVLCS